MKAEIITIGDELLIGQVIDTNSAWLAHQLNLIGIFVYQITSISDDKMHIINALNEAISRVDLIMITGGLGPTNDDITKKTLAEYFQCDLVLNPDVLKDVESLLSSRGIKVIDLNRKQAEVPSRCTIIRNLCGTAPGMWFEEKDKVFISMPGVPFEMKDMTSKEVIPRLKIKFNLQPVFHKIILLQGIAESLLAQKIKNWESSLDSNLKLAYLPSPGLMKLRISAYGGNLSDINAVVASKIVELNDLVGEYIYGYDDASLEEIIGALLKEKNKTLSTAESCTGGNIARLITSVPGASEYYIGSVIAYSNEIKQNCLKVKEETIKLKGAVSNEVAEAMAVGVRNLFHTDYAIGISGIAGPTGATENKPVGMTCISVVGPIHKITKTFYLGDNRERNIQKASITALNLLRKLIVSQ